MSTNSINEMLTSVSAALERDTRINVHKSQITVRAENEKVILEGIMENIAEKRAAVDITRRTLLGRWPTIDKLRVKPAEVKKDLELKEEVLLALTNEPVFFDYTLFIKVADGKIETVSIPE